jgi:hypothetical protein
MWMDRRPYPASGLSAKPGRGLRFEDESGGGLARPMGAAGRRAGLCRGTEAKDSRRSSNQSVEARRGTPERLEVDMNYRLWVVVAVLAMSAAGAAQAQSKPSGLLTDPRKGKVPQQPEGDRSIPESRPTPPPLRDDPAVGPDTSRPGRNTEPDRRAFVDPGQMSGNLAPGPGGNARAPRRPSIAPPLTLGGRNAGWKTPEEIQREELRKKAGDEARERSKNYYQDKRKKPGEAGNQLPRRPLPLPPVIVYPPNGPIFPLPNPALPIDRRVPLPGLPGDTTIPRGPLPPLAPR